MEADEPVQLEEIAMLKAENERLKKELDELKKTKN